MHMNLIFMGGKSLQVCHINDKMLKLFICITLWYVLLTIYEDIHDCNTCVMILLETYQL